GGDLDLAAELVVGEAGDVAARIGGAGPQPGRVIGMLDDGCDRGAAWRGVGGRGGADQPSRLVVGGDVGAALGVGLVGLVTDRVVADQCRRANLTGGAVLIHLHLGGGGLHQPFQDVVAQGGGVVGRGGTVGVAPRIGDGGDQAALVIAESGDDVLGAVLDGLAGDLVELVVGVAGGFGSAGARSREGLLGDVGVGVVGEGGGASQPAWVERLWDQAAGRVVVEDGDGGAVAGHLLDEVARRVVLIGTHHHISGCSGAVELGVVGDLLLEPVVPPVHVGGLSAHRINDGDQSPARAIGA